MTDSWAKFHYRDLANRPGDTRFIKTRDGRTLAYVLRGDPKGMPTVLFHGMPGSRIGPLPLASQLYQQGFYLISFDRPGYGLSDPQDNHRVVNVVKDVEDLLAELNVDKFIAIGRSGGGPYAEACAADKNLGKRVLALGLLCST